MKALEAIVSALALAVIALSTRRLMHPSAPRNLDEAFIFIFSLSWCLGMLGLSLVRIAGAFVARVALAIASVATAAAWIWILAFYPVPNRVHESHERAAFVPEPSDYTFCLLTSVLFGLVALAPLPTPKNIWVRRGLTLAPFGLLTLFLFWFA